MPQQYRLGKEDTLLENLLENYNPFEVLGKPQLMLSEGYGAYQESGDATDAIGAALNAFYRGSDERQYGTMGEQLVPEEIGEDWKRKAFRFGVDIGTDPLLLLPGSVGKLAVKGAIAPYKYGYKAAQALPGVGKYLPTGAEFGAKLWGSQAGRALSRWTRPMAAHIDEYGGPAGNAYTQKAARMFETAEVDATRYAQEISQIADNAGLTGWRKMFGKSQGSAPGLITDALETGNLQGSGIKAVDEAATGMRSWFDKMRDTAVRYRDLYDEPFKVFDAEADKMIPFAEEVAKGKYTNYVPQRIRSEVMEQLRSLSPEDGVKYLTKNYNLKAGLAHKLVPRARKAGSLELARTVELPKEMLERNIFKLAADYSDDFARRSSYGSEFGLGGKALGEIATAMKNAGLEDDVVETAVRVADGIPKFSEYGLDKMARGLMGWQVLSKMGPASTLSNISQQSNTFIREGGTAYTKGLLKSMGPEGYKKGARAWGKVQEKTMKEVMGIDDSGMMGKAAEKWLTATGFNFGERMNRTVAANTGVATAERMLNASDGQLTKELTRRGLNKLGARAYRELGRVADVEDFGQLAAKFGESNADEMIRSAQRVGLRASDATQHATRLMDVPVAWQSPEVKLMTQFKSFIYQQSRFIGREIAKPAIKWYQTGGKEGSLGPLYRAAAAYGMAGPTVGLAREGLKQTVADAIGAKHNPYYEFDWDNPNLSIIKGMGYVGGFGIAQDIVNAMQRGSMGDWVLGPTIGDAFDIGRTGTNWATDYAMEGEVPDEEKVYGEIYRRTLRGGLPMSPQEFGERAARLTK